MARGNLSILIFLLIVRTIASEFTPIVQTNKGPVQGEIWKTVWNGVRFSSFRGIPYGKPPIGYLRFKPPLEADPWTEPLLTIKNGNVCVQVDIISRYLIGSEDCLFLNVYTPETTFNDTRNNLRAVMVWIHGGGYILGDSNSTFYGPDYLIEDDVVVVTFNYRLSVLGFLALDHANATGNAGLKDQVLALEWVRANIRNFGGDPNNVTLFGESAGASAVDFHIVSERSRGLFQRSIAMSGTIMAFWALHTPDVARRRAIVLGELLGQNTTNTEELLQLFYRTSAKDLIAAAWNVTQVALPYTGKRQQTLIDIPFRPTIENSVLAPAKDIFISDCPLVSFSKGNFAKQPHMMGATRHEAVLFVPLLLPLFELIQFLLSLLRGIVMAIPILASLDLTGFFSFPETNEAMMLFLDMLSDVAFTSPNYFKHRIVYPRNQEHPLYYYRVSYDTVYSLRGMVNITLDGPGHADDLNYIFYISLIDSPSDPSHPLNVFRKKMVRLWTNFAKHGNPTPYGTNDPMLKATWPDSGYHGWQLDIDNELTIIQRPESWFINFMETITEIAAPFYLGCHNQLASIVANFNQFLQG